MTLIQVTALVHIEDHGQPGLCARDFIDTTTYEGTILDWDEVIMVAIPQDTSQEPF